jgi:hypothetical protein
MKRMIERYKFNFNEEDFLLASFLFGRSKINVKGNTESLKCSLTLHPFHPAHTPPPPMASAKSPPIQGELPCEKF